MARVNGFLAGQFDVVGRLKIARAQNIYDADIGAHFVCQEAIS